MDTTLTVQVRVATHGSTLKIQKKAKKTEKKLMRIYRRWKAQLMIKLKRKEKKANDARGRELRARCLVNLLGPPPDEKERKRREEARRTARSVVFQGFELPA